MVGSIKESQKHLAILHMSRAVSSFLGSASIHCFGGRGSPRSWHSAL